MADLVTDSIFAPPPQRHQQQLQAQEFSVDSTNLLTGYVYTAKRLLGALSWAVQQHESVYGVLETDIQKRMQQLRS